MFPILLLQAPVHSEYYLPKGDVVGFTFFVSTFALLAAALFFLAERNNVPQQWRTSMTVAGIICLIAGVNYFYMRGLYLTTGESPTQFRYIDWVLTVPMLAAQFYLLLSRAGAKMSSLWTLVIGALWMIAFGYVGEVSTTGHPMLWGFVSTFGYVAIVYEVWFGRLAKVVDKSDNEEVVQAFNYLGYFVLIGWAIYPLGYMMLPGNLLQNLHLDMNLVYNFGDAINKVGFGLVVYSMARRAQQQAIASAAPTYVAPVYAEPVVAEIPEPVY
ncbi:bacteriorhodopsin [Hymenobacter sp.]|jgi:bacteriorhodopsin|uniref:bacteriorhodopsin n=1 Tax=Hymenobacter sp. TaxID=1898978 RepID=UPI002EDB1C4B